MPGGRYEVGREFSSARGAGMRLPGSSRVPGGRYEVARSSRVPGRRYDVAREF